MPSKPDHTAGPVAPVVPPIPASFQHHPEVVGLPQGKEWDKLGADDRKVALQEAARRARQEGKTLLDIGAATASADLQQMRGRAKSVSQRR